MAVAATLATGLSREPYVRPWIVAAGLVSFMILWIATLAYSSLNGTLQ